jgi:hypothetical protein
MGAEACSMPMRVLKAWGELHQPVLQQKPGRPECQGQVDSLAWNRVAQERVTGARSVAERLVAWCLFEV